jgi:hypothetical protein
MFSAKFNFFKQLISKLFNKNQLQTLDVAYNGQPFVNIVSQSQDTSTLDIVYNGQPFYGVK